MSTTKTILSKQTTRRLEERRIEKKNEYENSQPEQTRSLVQKDLSPMHRILCTSSDILQGVCDFFSMSELANTMCLLNVGCRNLILNRIICSKWGSHVKFSQAKTIVVYEGNISRLIRAVHKQVLSESESFHNFKMIRFSKGVQLQGRYNECDRDLAKNYAEDMKKIFPMFSNVTYLCINTTLLSSRELSDQIFSWIENGTPETMALKSFECGGYGEIAWQMLSLDSLARAISRNSTLTHITLECSHFEYGQSNLWKCIADHKIFQHLHVMCSKISVRNKLISDAIRSNSELCDISLSLVFFNIVKYDDEKDYEIDGFKQLCSAIRNASNLKKFRMCSSDSSINVGEVIDLVQALYENTNIDCVEIIFPYCKEKQEVIHPAFVELKKSSGKNIEWILMDRDGWIFRW